MNNKCLGCSKKNEFFHVEHLLEPGKPLRGIRLASSIDKVCQVRSILRRVATVSLERLSYIATRGPIVEISLGGFEVLQELFAGSFDHDEQPQIASIEAQ